MTDIKPTERANAIGNALWECLKDGRDGLDDLGECFIVFNRRLNHSLSVAEIRSAIPRLLRNVLRDVRRPTRPERRTIYFNPQLTCEDES